MENLRLMLWNMEWLNRLFDENSEFHPDNNYYDERSKVTYKQKKNDLKAVIEEINPDILVVVEGPSSPAELQLFFDFIEPGAWITDLQTTTRSIQNIGIAVNIASGKFNTSPLVRFDATSIPAFGKFELNQDSGITELYKFERLPLYVELTAMSGNKFRLLGLHLKSKGIFNAFEWSKWWDIADANRRKIIAQASQIRINFLDNYLRDQETKDIPLIVCGDINDGPGLDASEKRLLGSGIERLMGNIWFPELCLGNAIFDSLDLKDKHNQNFTSVYTTSFKDPIFNGVYQKEWIDHILYSKNKKKWVTDAVIHEKLPSGKITWKDYKHASDHYPVSVNLKI